MTHSEFSSDDSQVIEVFLRVLHRNNPWPQKDGDGYKEVATVCLDCRGKDDKSPEFIRESLEKVFELTNNTQGSWARGPGIALPPGPHQTNPNTPRRVRNEDYDKRVEVHGKRNGRRSTSVWDLVEFLGVGLYQVEGLGFSTVRGIRIEKEAA
jgi:hypothetical protein